MTHSELLWMEEIRSHHFETMVGNQSLLVFTRELSFQGVLGGAGFRQSTVWKLWVSVCHLFLFGYWCFMVCGVSKSGVPIPPPNPPPPPQPARADSPGHFFAGSCTSSCGFVDSSEGVLALPWLPTTRAGPGPHRANLGEVGIRVPDFCFCSLF